jgi:nicotinamidase-related amidase
MPTPERPPLDPLTPPTHPLTLDPHETALFVVDLQYFDAHRDWGEGRTARALGVLDAFEPYFARIDEILPRAAALLAAFRAAGAEVVHARVCERTPDARDVAPKQLLRGLLVPPGSMEAAFLPDVAPTADELVFDKSSSGLFPATDADRLLRNLQVGTLVFCGTSTSGCVESSVRDAVDLGYRVVIAEDACAASTAADHAAALARMRGPTCRIASVAEIAAALARGPKRDAAAVAGTTRVQAYLPENRLVQTAASGGAVTLPLGAAKPDPYALIFPPPRRVDVDPRDSALLILDAHLLATDPTAPLLAAVHAAEPDFDLTPLLQRIDAAFRTLDPLLRAAHASGVPVIHVRTAARSSRGRDLAPAMRALLGDFPAAHPATALDPRVPTHPDDLILTKPGQGPFTGTGLDDTLRHVGVRNLVLGGISTLGAIEAALRGATDRGYGVLLIPEACAAGTTVDQRRLAGMGAGLIEVVSLQEGIARIRVGGR